MMSSMRWVVLLLGFAGCSGGGTELEGLFELESFTTNNVDCTSDGSPSYEQDLYSHFFVREDFFFGQRMVNTVMCNDLETCRADAADTEALFLGGFIFTEVNDEGYWTGLRGFLNEENDCAGTIREAVLTGEPGVSIRIEEEARSVTSGPLDAEGDCDLQAARAMVAAQPCEGLTVVTGVFVEDI